jgi:hydrogenase/urease accessory protein HupE
MGTLPIHPTFADHVRQVTPIATEMLPGAQLQRWTVDAGPQGIDGSMLAVHNLPGTSTDVLVRVAFLDGRVVSRVLRPDAPSVTIDRAAAGPAAAAYFRLGVEHILLGADHLLFVLCLLLLVRGVGRVVKTITAFTVAHSVTLGLATLGYVNLPPPPAEAVIALSIVFLAVEIAKRREGAPSLTERRPWVVAFAFGLLHGFGFAGALGDVGLPQGDVPLALLLFNVGVEAGQLLFVAAAVAVVAAARRFATAEPPAWLRPTPAYAIGTVAAFWLVARVVAVL